MKELQEKALRNKADLDAVYEAGKQSGGGGDSFWDIYQQNGTRTIYQNAFSGNGWADETFKPKYDIKPQNAVQMFHTTGITNLKKILDECGVVLDFSNCTSWNYIFQYSNITHIGVIDARKAYFSYFAPSAKFVYVEKLILKDDGSQSFNGAYSFGYCTDLEHIIFEGVIGQNGLDLHWSTKLDADSLKSIIDCLSTTTTGLTVTLPTTAERTFNAVYGDLIPWEAYITNRPNWTIAYL